MARKPGLLSHVVAKKPQEINYKQHKTIAIQANRGFSLIEVLVSLSLFASCLLTLVSLQIQAQGLLVELGLTHQALAFASSHRERQGVKESLENTAREVIRANSEDELRQIMPEVLIKTVEKKGYKQYELFWPSHYPGQTCAFSDQADTACIRI